MRSLQALDTTFTVTFPLLAVECDGQNLLATIDSDYGNARKTRRVDQVVVNHGTRPLDELYFELKTVSSNGGVVENQDLIVGNPQNELINPDGKFHVFLIGDAVAARNTHAAIYDALIRVKDL